MIYIKILAVYCLIMNLILYLNTIKTNKNKILPNIIIVFSYFLPLLILIIYCLKSNSYPTIIKVF